MIERTERWSPVPIPGFEATYEVSDLGRVRRIVPDWRSNPGGYLNPCRHARGLSVVLSRGPGKGGQHFLVHRLVALAFCGATDEHAVKPLNGDIYDPRAENVVLVARSEVLSRAGKKARALDKGKGGLVTMARHPDHLSRIGAKGRAMAKPTGGRRTPKATPPPRPTTRPPDRRVFDPKADEPNADAPFRAGLANWLAERQWRKSS